MLKNFFGGLQRKANLKQNGVMSVVEVKQPMSLQGYKVLAKKSLAQQGDYNIPIFSNFFLLLRWNLMARIFCRSLTYDYISWVNDALVTVFPSH